MKFFGYWFEEGQIKNWGKNWRKGCTYIQEWIKQTNLQIPTVDISSPVLGAKIRLGPAGTRGFFLRDVSRQTGIPTHLPIQMCLG